MARNVHANSALQSHIITEFYCTIYLLIDIQIGPISACGKISRTKSKIGGDTTYDVILSGWHKT